VIQIVVKRQYPIEYVISTLRPSERENNMAKAKGGLGRGLDSLISNAVDSSSSDRLTTVAIADIQPGRYQARVQMDGRNWLTPLKRKALSSRLSYANVVCLNMN